MRICDQESERSSDPTISLILSKIGFARALTSLHYITCKYIYIYAQCLTKHRSLDHTNVKTKKQDLLRSKKKAYPRTQSNSEDYCLQEKITLEVFLFNLTHFMSRVCFHQVIHLI